MPESTQSPIQWVRQLKRPEPETHPSPSSSAEVRNEWSGTSAPPTGFRGADRYEFTVCVYSDSNTGPAFVHRSLWQCVSGGGILNMAVNQCSIVGNPC
jgi:hypothetical protein